MSMTFCLSSSLISIVQKSDASWVCQRFVLLMVYVPHQLFIFFHIFYSLLFLRGSHLLFIRSIPDIPFSSCFFFATILLFHTQLSIARFHASFSSISSNLTGKYLIMKLNVKLTSNSVKTACSYQDICFSKIFQLLGFLIDHDYFSAQFSYVDECFFGP